ncbi:MAG: nucleotidyltransferase family protein [Caldilinea sp. CFX5]|nr:nucleotidyltransferase family protein [Caldilinea sp. CFX5]
MKEQSIVERRAENVTVVVLAAGRSSRMGRAKQLEVVDGAPMVVRATQTALATIAGGVLVVTGAYAPAVTVTLAPILEVAGDRLRLVHNAAWATGQASSVRAAVMALPPNCQAALFLPTDQPFVPVVLLNELITTWQHGERLVAPTVDGQPRGAPALFDCELWPELLALEGDTGARPLLQRHRAELVTLAAEAQWLRDIDRPEDLPTA